MNPPANSKAARMSGSTINWRKQILWFIFIVTMSTAAAYLTVHNMRTIPDCATIGDCDSGNGGLAAIIVAGYGAFYGLIGFLVLGLISHFSKNRMVQKVLLGLFWAAWGLSVIWYLALPD